MLKTTKITLFFILMIPGYVSTQVFRWENIHGPYNYTYETIDAVCDVDGAFVIANAKDLTTGLSSLYIVKFSLANGSMVWQVRYPEATANKIIKENDTIWVLGTGLYLYPRGKSIITLCINANNGNYNWVQMWDHLAGDLGKAIIKNGSQVYIGGRTDTLNMQKFILLSYNAHNGEKQFETVFMGGNNFDEPQYIGVNPIDNSIYLCGLTGTALVPQTSWNWMVIRYNADGVVQWNKTYNGTADKDDVARFIVFDNNNPIVIGMGTEENNVRKCVMLKFNPHTGEITNSVKYSFGQAHTDIRDVKEFVDYVYILNSAVNNNGGRDGNLLKLNPETLNIEWASEFIYNMNVWNDPVEMAILNTNVIYVVMNSSLTINSPKGFVTMAVSAHNGLPYWNSYKQSGSESYVSCMSKNDDNIIVSGYSSISSHDADIYTVLYKEITRNPGNRLNENDAPLDLRSSPPVIFKNEIKFSLKILDNIKIIVYDILGKEVEILVNSSLKEGAYSYKLSNKLASGIYFIKFESKMYNKTLKHILTK